MQRPERDRGRILIVEDEPMVMELITTRLILAGYTTYSARNGELALERIAEVKPSAMILDINMPGLDGFGVLERLKESGVIAQLPTLVLTARNSPEDVRRAVTLGARDYLAKPFNDEQLLGRVARLVRKVNPAPPAPQHNAPQSHAPEESDALML